MMALSHQETLSTLCLKINNNNTNVMFDVNSEGPPSKCLALLLNRVALVVWTI